MSQEITSYSSLAEYRNETKLNNFDLKTQRV